MVRSGRDRQLRFLSGDRAWQENDRIIRRPRHEKRLSARGAPTKELRELRGRCTASEGRPHHFVAAKVTEGTVRAVVDTMRVERNAYLLMTTRPEAAVEALLEAGWSGDPTSGIELFASVASAGDVLFIPFGAFDDRECGLVGIGPTRLVGSTGDDSGAASPVE